MVNSLINAFENKSGGLIHCITNPISINQCANVIIALSAKPIMAEHPDEVCQITASSKALLINLGNITDVRIKSMKKSAKTANKAGIPVVLDAVGVACSRLRRKFAHKLISKYNIDIVKGNYSEIYAMYNDDYTVGGVDGDENLNCTRIAEISKILARKYRCVILASGKTDIITDGESVYFLNNGTPMMSQVTGTGCMLGAVCTVFCADNDALLSAILACTVMSVCAEKVCAENGSFTTKLIDEISMFKSEYLKEIKLEKRKDENI